jgi:hypothetical protein
MLILIILKKYKILMGNQPPVEIKYARFIEGTQ